MSPTESIADTDFEHLARRRAGAKMGWFIHATVYAIVNLLSLALAFMSARHWPVAPALAWGLDLAIHGTVVFWLSSGAGLHQRLLQRDPW